MDQNPTKRIRDTPSNSNVVWFALIIAVAVIISAFMIVNQSKTKMQFSDFRALMKVTRYENVGSDKLRLPEGYPGKLIIEGKSGGKIEYSKPNLKSRLVNAKSAD